MAATISEIAPLVHRITVYESQYDLQFNHFLVRDEEPLLFHTGPRELFDELRPAVARLITPGDLRWICWSHFEADECGGLNRWLDVAPRATAVATPLAAAINVNDFAARPPRVLPADETLETGQCRFRLLTTPHLPHAWDAALLFEETGRTLFCSDLFMNQGDGEALTQSEDFIDRARAALDALQATPFGDSTPCTPKTDTFLARLADLKPATLATAHGASFAGDCAAMLRQLGAALKDAYARPVGG